VKAGDPNGENIPHWPPVTVNGKQVMEFGKSAAVFRSLPEGAENGFAARAATCVSFDGVTSHGATDFFLKPAGRLI
jgi:hypothetical protein